MSLSAPPDESTSDEWSISQLGCHRKSGSLCRYSQAAGRMSVIVASVNKLELA